MENMHGTVQKLMGKRLLQHTPDWGRRIYDEQRIPMLSEDNNWLWLQVESNTK